jgi:hypothetical protein
MGRRAVKAAQRGWSAAKATGKRVIRGAKRTYTAAKATAKRVITGARGVVRKTYHAAKRTAKAAVRGAKTIAQTVKKGTQTVVKGAHSVVKGAIASAKSLPQNATNTAKKAYRGAEKWLTENPKAAMALGAAAVVGGIGLTIATGGLAGLAIGGALAGAGTSAWLQGAQIADGAKDENGKPKTFSLKEVGTGALLGGAGGAIGGPLAAAAFKAAPTLVGVAGAGALGMGARSAHSNWQQGKKWSALAEGALAAPGALSFMSGKSLTAMFGRQALTTTGRSAQALVNGKAIQSAIHSGKSMAQTAVSQGRSLFGNGTSGFRPATVGGHPGALGQFQPRVQNVKSNSGQQTGGMSATPGKTTEKTSGIPEKPIAEGQPGIYEKKDFNVESIAAQRQQLKQPKPPQPPKQSPLDPWLESKGYQPKSQERSLSKAEYKAQAHQQRVSQRWASGSYSATNAEVQPRHMTKLEHALKFKNIGKSQKASQLVRELKAEMGPERYAALKRAYLQEQKGTALKGNQLKGAPYRVSERHIDLMRPDDRFSVNSQKREPLEGYFDVIAHGVEKPAAPTTKIRVQTLGRDVGVDHRTLAKLLKRQKGCYNGQPIRLLSCSTGNAPDGFAQNLANKTNKEIIAPSNTVWAGDKGEFTISQMEVITNHMTGKQVKVPKTPYTGEWRTFNPRSNGSKAENHPVELDRSATQQWLPEGYKPQPSERAVTKEQWKEQSSKLRLANSLKYKNQRTELAQTGGLSATEGVQITNATGKYAGKLGSKAHPLTEHGPQKPLSEVFDRLTKNPKMLKATKFTSRSKMESSIAKTLRAKKTDIDAWLQTSPPAGKNMPTIKYQPKMGNLGIGYERSAPGGSISKTNSTLENIVIVLKSDGKGSFIIQTAYPE